MKRRIGAVLFILSLLFALSAYAESTWQCDACHRRVQTMLGDQCPYCGAQRHIHTWREATCTEPKTCTECGETEGEALGHQWGEGKVIQEATCRTAGVKSYTCVRCGTVREENFGKNPENHSGGTEVESRVDAGCVSDGYTGNVYCKGCGSLISIGEAIPALGHQWDAGTVVRAANCRETGVTRYCCERCGAAREEESPKNPDSHSGEKEVRFRADATCTEPGYTVDTYCRDCGALISGGNAIAALGHRWTDATYSSPKTCARCGATEGKPLTLPVSVGDTMTFGSYPQTSSGTDKTAIEWMVLDVQGSRVLLLSRYGLDSKRYNEKAEKITWEQCSLRTWLNEDFLNAAFSAKEQESILLTGVDNGKSQGYWNTEGGNDTQDRVFLLSYAEANRYLGVSRDGKTNKTGRAAPTAYAKAAGASPSSKYKTPDGKASDWWWLRSPGSKQSSAADVHNDGSLRNSPQSVRSGGGCVRPALWIDLDSGLF
ncbi:MAG: hypothetical protein IKE30_00240 [Clostridia bacterium]|nr:hypothetical protein [Clostridia bacterium]